MKKVYKYITKVARPINKGIIWIALLLTYLVICLYHFLLHQKAAKLLLDERASGNGAHRAISCKVSLRTRVSSSATDQNTLPPAGGK